MSTWNLSNLFGGYLGQPRKFEVIALAGGVVMYRAWTQKQKGGIINAKLAFDLALNLGDAKQWQVYLEPGVVLGQPYPHYANPFRKTEFLFNGKKWNGASLSEAGC